MCWAFYHTGLCPYSHEIDGLTLEGHCPARLHARPWTGPGALDPASPLTPLPDATKQRLDFSKIFLLAAFRDDAGQLPSCTPEGIPPKTILKPIVTCLRTYLKTRQSFIRVQARLHASNIAHAETRRNEHLARAAMHSVSAALDAHNPDRLHAPDAITKKRPRAE